MAVLRISLLGPFQVSLDGQPVGAERQRPAFATDSTRALLAYLAVEGGWRSDPAPIRREVLAGLLWPDRPEAAARHALAQTLTRLHRALRPSSEPAPEERDADSPYVLVSRDALQLNLSSDCWLDVAAFRQAIEACAGHGHRHLEGCSPCIERLREAVELYRGEFMAGFSLPSAPFEEWLLAQREAVRIQALDALHALAAYHERRREHEPTLRYARRQLELEPWREAAHRQAMRALAQSGQRDAALAQYEACRQALAQELGVEPEGETTALYEQIHGDLSGLSDLTGLSRVPPHNLPAPLTPFVGRERELADIGSRLQNVACRLLTLVGLGGSGKTRLALEAAEEQAAAFEHGVFWVPLAAVDAPEDIVPAIAQALGLTFQAAHPGQFRSQRQQLLDYLRGKELLLVLDNCEHLFAGHQVVGPGLLADLLAAVPAVKVLATSRARLNLQGEEVLTVGGMEYPPSPLPLTPSPLPSGEDGGRGEVALHYGAVSLFLHAARRARPEYHLTAEDLPHIAHICRLVEGMPLGILLAAAWVTVLTPAEIARQLATEAGRTLDFLAADWPDAPERHRSMRAVMDSCWCMLSEREQQVFAALAVFRGGFTHDAAREVAGADLSMLRSLAHKSFLQVDQEGRYAMHELLRQYGEGKLSADPVRLQQVRERHAAYYAVAAVGWEAGLKGKRGDEVLAEMGIEIHNAQAAWQWLSQTRDVFRLGQRMYPSSMIHAMGEFYTSRGLYQQGESAFGAAADCLAPTGQTATADTAALFHVRGRLLTWQGRCAFLGGRRPQAVDLLRQAQAALDEAERAGQDVRAARAWMLHSMWERVADVDRGAFRGLAEQSLALYRELSDPWGIVCVLSDLGITAFLDGAYPLARQMFEECLALSRRWGIKDAISGSATFLTWIAACQGEVDRAEEMVRELTAPGLASDNPVARAGGLWLLGSVLESCGQYAAAEPLVEEGMALMREWGAGVFLYRLLVDSVETMLNLGHYERVRTLGREGVERARQMEAWIFVGWALMSLAQVSVVAGANQEAAQILEESITLLRRAGARDFLGRGLGCMAYVARGLGQADQAWQCMSQALRLAVECQAVHPLLLALPAAALLLADRGHTERAVELYALAWRHPVVANSRWFEDVAGRHLAAVAAALPVEVREQAQARGLARDLWATAHELLKELDV